MSDFNIGIITFNRADMLKKNLTKLSKYQKFINKIIVVNNGSLDNTKNILKSFSKNSKFKIINLNKNYGVVSKNVVFKKSNSKYLIFIDDDAIIQNISKVFSEIKNSFNKNKKLALINFKIIDNKKKKVIKREFPQKYNKYNLNKKLNISYFIGAGVVFKKEIYKKFSYINFFYTQEEIEMSYRIIDNNYVMEYNPKLVVRHYRDPKGRLPKNQVIFNNFFHKMILNYKYIPSPISNISNLLWFIKTWLDSRSLKLPILAIKRINSLQKHNKLKKKKLSYKSLLYIFSTNGRLFY